MADLMEYGQMHETQVAMEDQDSVVVAAIPKLNMDLRDSYA